MSTYRNKIIRTVAVFLALILSVTFFVFRTDVQASLLGPKAYYLLLEEDNFKEIKKSYKDSYLSQVMSEFSYQCKLTASVTGNYKNDGLETVNKVLSKLQFDIDYKANAKDLNNPFYTALVSTKYDGKTIIDTDIKSADRKTIIGFPGLTDKTIGIKSAENVFAKFLNSSDSDFEKMCGISRDTYDKMVKRYIKDVIFGQIPDDKVVYKKDTDFEGRNSNSITFNIDEKVITDIYKALANEIEKDKDLNKFIKSLVALFYDTYKELDDTIKKPSDTEIDEEIKEFCDELKEEAEDISEIDFTYKVYFNNDGDILSRQIHYPEENEVMALSTYKDILGQDVIRVTYKEEAKTVFDLKNAQKLNSSNNYEGVFTIIADDYQLLKADYTYEKDAKVGNLSAFIGNINGKITLGKSTANYQSPKISFIVSNKKTADDTMQGLFQLISDDKGKVTTFSVNTDIKQSNVCGITKPDVNIDKSIKLTDYDDFESLIKEVSDNLEKRMKTLFPEEFKDKYGDEFDF